MHQLKLPPSIGANLSFCLSEHIRQHSSKAANCVQVSGGNISTVKMAKCMLFSPLIFFVLSNDSSKAFALSLSMKGTSNKVTDKTSSYSVPTVNRRNAIISASATLFGIAGSPANTKAELPQAETIDLAAIKAAQSKAASTPGVSSIISSGGAGIVPIKDPNPFLSIRAGLNGKSSIKIPRVGYSFYKTSPDMAARSTALALRTGIRHFDASTLYGSNIEISVPLKKYLDIGIDGIDYSNENPDLLSFLDSMKEDGDRHALTTASSGLISAAAPAPLGSAGRRGRREGLFISHKIQNDEQSTKRIDVRRAVKSQIAALGTQYLDMVSIHSPLTDRERRLESYSALLELRDAGFVKSVGVCNYGIGPLKEMKEYGLELPAINQLELSPFNTHSDVVSWCQDNNIAIGCAAWSKLSGTDGPQEQWQILSEIARKKDMTKAQVLVRWGLQKGYVCVPRSATASKIERLAIGENSYGGVNRGGKNNILTDEEMSILDTLNIDLRAGKLGRRDGWNDNDVTGIEWDPTNFL